ncbi:MAG: hypothetical protein Q9N67_10385 [Ghiorsea sp.]|nr:hypothetical protein [Ghiorsea sp.]MDQ7005288.1 hypothetical protein [Ghiorsea sp.]
MMRYTFGWLVFFCLFTSQAEAASLANTWHTSTGVVQALHVGERNNLYYSADTPTLNQLSANQSLSTWVSSTQLAAFSQASGITTDSLGNIYFTDSAANALYFIDITTGNIKLVTNLLNQPAGIAITMAGDIVVANMGTNQVLLVNPNGNSSIIAGNGGAGYTGDSGLAVDAQLNLPSGIAIDGSAIYVSELGNHTVRRFTIGGSIQTMVGTGIASFVGDNGSATLATLNQPTDIALDPAGNLLIADTANHRIRRMNSIDHIITTIAGTGSSIANTTTVTASPALSTNLPSPTAIATDSLGNIYVNSGQQIIQLTADSNAVNVASQQASCISSPLASFSWLSLGLMGLFLYRLKPYSDI